MMGKQFHIHLEFSLIVARKLTLSCWSLRFISFEDDALTDSFMWHVLNSRNDRLSIINLWKWRNHRNITIIVTFNITYQEYYYTTHQYHYNKHDSLCWGKTTKYSTVDKMMANIVQLEEEVVEGGGYNLSTDNKWSMYSFCRWVCRKHLWNINLKKS